MWKQLTFADIDAPTSSPELPGGNSPCSSPDGPATESVGPVPARANRTRRRASAKATPTPATCGPCSPGSSASAALQQSLESRLRALFGSGGSTEYAQTWKRKATPSGSPYSEHTASARRTSDSGCTGAQPGPWPTATVNDSRGGRNRTAGRSNLGSKHHDGLTLCDAALMVPVAGWATPAAMDGSRGPDLSDSWTRPSGHNRSTSLQSTAALCGTTGATPLASTAETGSGGASLRLNAAFSAWLMGFPPIWDEVGCRVQLATRSRAKAPTAPQGSEGTETPSACKRRRRS